jgi:hypothetical protein
VEDAGAGGEDAAAGVDAAAAMDAAVAPDSGVAPRDGGVPTADSGGAEPEEEEGSGCTCVRRERGLEGGLALIALGMALVAIKGKHRPR